MVSSGEIGGCCSGRKMVTRLNKYIRHQAGILATFLWYACNDWRWVLVDNYTSQVSTPVSTTEPRHLFAVAQTMTPSEMKLSLWATSLLVLTTPGRISGETRLVPTVMSVWRRFYSRISGLWSSVMLSGLNTLSVLPNT